MSFRRWLSGSFTCIRCGHTFTLMTFGYGECLCPDCYPKNGPFMALDPGFILNRLLKRLIK